MKFSVDPVPLAPIIKLLEINEEKMSEKTPPLSFKTIPVYQAVGTTFAHDMTEIIPGMSKGPACKKDHKIKSEDLCRLMRMGKNSLYIIDLNENQVLDYWKKCASALKIIDIWKKMSWQKTIPNRKVKSSELPGNCIEPATPSEARQILGFKSLDQVAF